MLRPFALAAACAAFLCAAPAPAAPKPPAARPGPAIHLSQGQQRELAAGLIRLAVDLHAAESGGLPAAERQSRGFQARREFCELALRVLTTSQKRRLERAWAADHARREAEARRAGIATADELGLSSSHRRRARQMAYQGLERLADIWEDPRLDTAGRWAATWLAVDQARDSFLALLTPTQREIAARRWADAARRGGR